MAGTPLVMRLREPMATNARKPMNADGGGGAQAVGQRVDRAPAGVTEVAQPGVGVEVVGEERAQPGGAADLELPQLGVVHPPQALRRADGRRGAGGRGAGWRTSRRSRPGLAGADR